jgi:hypothetical protein
LTAPSYKRNRKFVRVNPAMAETCFQLKWNCTTGVQPLGAHVLTRVGRSDSPDSSMKTISRCSAAHFFERGPALAFPRQHRLLIALHGPSLAHGRSLEHAADRLALALRG